MKWFYNLVKRPYAQISEYDFAMIKKKQDWKCAICGVKEGTTFKNKYGKEFSLRLTQDHIVPKSKGGPTTPENIQALCFSCNQKKSNIYPYIHGSKGNIKKRRLFLYKRDKHCSFCGVETQLYRRNNKQATVYHLRSKAHPLKQEPNPTQEERTALACKKCSNEKSRLANGNLPRYEQWKRSGRFPNLRMREKEIIELDEFATCERCNNTGAFDFDELFVCANCYGVCLSCHSFFILGEDEYQKICWECLENE